MAQETPAGYRHFTVDEGLPSSEVYEILQDRQGFIWFATDNGLSRFNGYQFENFGPMEGLEDPVVFFLQEDAKGRIWTKSMSGVLHYLEKDSFHAFLGNAAMDTVKASGVHFGNFYVDSLGYVYNSIFPIGLMRFLPDGQGTFLIRDQNSTSVYMVENRPIVVACNVDAQNPDALKSQLTNTKKNHTDLILYHEGQQFQEMLPYEIKDKDNAVCYLNDNTVLMKTNGYLFGFQKGRLAWQVPFPEHVVAMLQNSKGEILFGLGNRKGVMRFTSIDALRLNRCDTLLRGYSVPGILEDRQGGYWFATTESGVFYLPNVTMESYNNDAGISFEYINSIVLKNGQEAFVGLRGGGVVNVNTHSKKITLLPYVGNEISDLAYDVGLDILWASVDEFNLHYLSNGKWHRMADPLNSKKQKKEVTYQGKHFHFSCDRHSLWAASHSGFIQIDPNKQSVNFTNLDVGFQAGPYVHRTHDVYTTSSGRTWVASISGLFELKDRQLVAPEQEHPAFQARIEALEELPDSTLVIASKRYGLVFWKNNRVKFLTAADGLTSNALENLHVDAQGNLWVGTSNGLNKVIWRWDGQVTIKKITTAHGLFSNEITDIASGGDFIWVGTIKGLNRFSDSKPNLYSPKPVLASVWNDQHALDLTVPLDLSYWENNIVVNFFAINFKMNGQILYRYRFGDEAWTKTYSTVLNFPSLRPGTHHMEIQAQNEDGIWSESLVFIFLINPPWWQTWWYGTLLFVAGVTLMWFFVLYRTAKVRNEEKLNAALKQKLLEMEMVALRSQMNPHFIFNCLNAINHFVLCNHSEQAASFIAKFSKLIRLVLDNSSLQKVALEKEIDAIRLYMDLEAMRFDGKFRYELWIGEDIDIQFTHIPPMLIQPYIENAIWHGLMHKSEGGHVVVDFKLIHENLLRIEILDDGIGRKRAAELESKTALNRNPQGTRITADRLRMLHSDNNSGDHIIIHDLLDKDGNPCGTKVVLEVPI